MGKGKERETGKEEKDKDKDPNPILAGSVSKDGTSICRTSHLGSSKAPVLRLRSRFRFLVGLVTFQPHQPQPLGDNENEGQTQHAE